MSLSDVSDLPISADGSTSCEGFSGVEYTLQSCVQQCLAREPILAVALMHKPRDFPSQVFMKTIFVTLQEARYNAGAGQTHGELHEQITMAALVTVSGQAGFDLLTVNVFVEYFYEFMNPSVCRPAIPIGS